LTRGRAATPDPFDISAVSDTDELFEALSTRRLADAGHDPASALLAALVADVDTDAPPLPASAPRVPCGGIQGQYRRGVRAFVTFGVAALVLTSAGAAAAGGGEDLGAMGGTHRSAGSGGSERSNENAQRHDPVGDGSAMLIGGRTPPRRTADRRPRAVTPGDDAVRPGDDADGTGEEPSQPWAHRGHRASRSFPRTPIEGRRPTGRTDPRSGPGRYPPPPEPTPSS
jgi:hypothetical protein